MSLEPVTILNVCVNICCIVRSFKQQIIYHIEKIVSTTLISLLFFLPIVTGYGDHSRRTIRPDPIRQTVLGQ